jgi:hypothetical protein
MKVTDHIYRKSMTEQTVTFTTADGWRKLSHQPSSLILTDHEQSWKVKTLVLMIDSKRSKS